jgi:acyl-CoA thioester hydrolase
MTSKTATGEQDLTAEDFAVLRTCGTRWADNDMFGHLNNAVYYQLFDSAINSWIIESTGVDPMSSPSVPVVAESSCRFFREVGFPDRLAVGLRIAHLGNSSVVYQVGLFADAGGAQLAPRAAAVGRWVHVYLDRQSRRPSRVPDAVRTLIAETL